MKTLSVIALAAAVAAGAGYANQSTAAKVVIPISKAQATNGRQMYVDYCAPCHGVDGRGRGPVASALKQPPTDLALLSKNNGGKFPSTHVVAVLEFGSRNPAHGTADMPVWGPVFGRIDEKNSQADSAALRITNISRYLETLQAK